MSALSNRRQQSASLSVADLTSEATQSNACIIASGTTIEGSFVSAEPIRLDGTIKGDITCGSKLVVGTQGRITGNVKARNVIVKGSIEGDVDAEGHIHLFASAKIAGNITATFFSVEEGAGFNGNSKVGRNKGA